MLRSRRETYEGPRNRLGAEKPEVDLSLQQRGVAPLATRDLLLPTTYLLPGASAPACNDRFVHLGKGKEPLSPTFDITQRYPRTFFRSFSFSCLSFNFFNYRD